MLPEDVINGKELKNILDGKIKEALTDLMLMVSPAFGSGEIKHCQKLIKLLALRKWTEELFEEDKKSEKANEYILGSMFVHRSYQHLIGFESEAVHYTTGPEINGKFFLDAMLPFRMSVRSWHMAAGDPKETHKLLQALDGFGHRLTGYFHTHPGTGINSTRPSSVDLSLQEKLERAGYPVIGGIFSTDGYLRFFSLNRKFNILIYGKRVVKEEHNVYRLTS